MKIKTLVAMMALAATTAVTGQVAETGTAGPILGKFNMLIRDSHPIVDGVFVNGHGPYRFLIDTGTNVNLIQTHLAQSIGLVATFRSELVSSGGVIIVSGRDGNEIVLNSVKADGQEFLFMGLEAIQDRWPDIQGVLGQWFLSRFDYMLDLRGKRLEFGKQDQSGTRAWFTTVNGRPTIATSLGQLILDSGANHLVLFGVKPDTGAGDKRELHTFAGSQEIGMVFSKSLNIEGRKIWRGGAVAMPRAAEPGVDGLMPLSLFKVICVCNSEGYIVFE